MEDVLSEFFHDFEPHTSGGDDLFAILETLDCIKYFPSLDEAAVSSDGKEGSKSATSSSIRHEFSEAEHSQLEASPKSKRQKLDVTSSEEGNMEGEQRVSHITVERKRRKQMNQHLTVLRSLMPCFYVKRGDQASIIGGVIDYINELQQVLQSLESKRHRKICSEVLSPRTFSSPAPSPIKSSLSPRLSLPITPTTPQSSSSYWPRLQPSGYLSPSSSSSTVHDAVSELVANSKSAVADVEVKFSGATLVLKTVSHRIPGQALKIISALEDLSLEILHASMSTVEETMIHSFSIKVQMILQIGIECKLSAEELAHQIHRTFL